MSERTIQVHRYRNYCRNPCGRLDRDTNIASHREKALERSKLDEVLHLFILKGTKITLWVVLIVAMLPKVGISPASLVAVLGAGGAAIALALKDSLSNVAGGIIILITKPFSRGDTIEIGEITGVVDNIDLLTTQLHTFDNKLIDCTERNRNQFRPY